MLKIIKENSANQNDKKFWVRFAKLGFSRDKSLYPESDEYNEILERITKIKFPEKRSIELPKYSLDEVKNETKSLRKKILAGVSLKISSFENELKMSENTKKVINKYKQNNVLYQMGTKTIDDFQQDIIKIYKDGTRTSSIYDIPIEPIEEDSMIGNCIKGPVIIVGDEDNNIERFLKMLPVLNEVIYLGNDYNKLSVGTYMHEMTHMLLDRHKGVVENYFNDEFLSIFMEKVAVDEVDDTPDKRFVKILKFIGWLMLNAILRN